MVIDKATVSIWGKIKFRMLHDFVLLTTNVMIIRDINNDKDVARYYVEVLKIINRLKLRK